MAASNNIRSLLYLIGFAATAASKNVGSLFGPHLSSGAAIYYPGDRHWTSDVEQRWSTWAAPTYRAAIKAATVQDVQNTVRIASANNISFLATAAGHGTSLTYGHLHSGIDIDISSMNQSHFDATTDTITIGGATKFKAIWDLLQPHKKEFPTGTAPCVGTMGATLGAGIGMLQGQHGLELDSLLSVKLVTASGDLITVSATHNADLFWVSFANKALDVRLTPFLGIRGAGFNFGIVVEATFKVYDASYGGMVMEADMAFPATANASIFQALKGFDGDALDPKLSLTVTAGYNRAADQAVLLVNAVYFGPNSTFVKYIKPFTDLNPVEFQSQLVAWNKLGEALFFGQDGTGCSDNLHLVVGGDGLKQTCPSDYEKFFADFTKFNRAYPAINATFVAQRYSSAGPLATPADETAYPYRDIETHLLFELVYPDDSMDGVFDDFIVDARKTFQPGSGYSNLTLYLNYNHGDEGPEVWYSPQHLPRLVELKQKWDPEEKFSWNCPIPLPSWSSSSWGHW